MEYGLIGRSLPHSFSPMLHRLIGGYDYGLLELEPEEIEGFFARRQFLGINVTIPYKTAVMKYCDVIDQKALDIGAVNTIVNRGGRLFGYNTDFDGLDLMLRYGGIELSGRDVLVLGTGGGAKTAAAVCKSRRCRSVYMVSRGEKAGCITYRQAGKMGSAQVIINATPAGMYPQNEGCPIDLLAFKKLEGAADLIYNPSRTRFLSQAEEMGAKTCGGLYMLAAQAEGAARLFTGRQGLGMPLPRLCAAVEREKLNIVLIGMPSSGKTTVGRALAELMGREFFDTDEEIERQARSAIAGIFRDRGEDAFRDMETEMIDRCCRRSGLVIATGGGAVLRRENIRLMGQNGVIVWLRRPLELLQPGQGRPLSQTREELKGLYIKRRGIYDSVSDVKIENTGSIAQAARKARDGFYEAVDNKWP